MVVGLEVHAELNTASKIYCNCRNAFGLEVNTQVCPVCMGMPGTLPTLNEKVVEYAIKMGHAMNCKINAVSKQDRKNYFYPDLPKAYQISQAEVPLCENGYLDIMVDGEEKRIGVTRIHIEEDAGKLLHKKRTVYCILGHFHSPYKRHRVTASGCRIGICTAKCAARFRPVSAGGWYHPAQLPARRYRHRQGRWASAAGLHRPAAP